MKKLYFSLTIIIFIGLIGLSWSIDSIYQKIDDKKDRAFPQSQQIFTAIKSHLDLNPSLIFKDALPPLFEIEDLTYFILPSPLKEQLMNGQLVLLNSDEGVTFHQRLNGKNKVLSMGPIKPLEHNDSIIPYILTTLFYLGIAIVLLLWFWPLLRAVMQLSDALKNIAKGKLGTRLNKPSIYLNVLFDDVNAMAQQLELLSENNQLFSQAVSHDIRTPLSRILFALEKLGDQNNAISKQVVSSIQMDVLKIESMSKELLHYARLSKSHTLQHEEIDVVLLIEQVMAGFDHHEINIEFSSNNVPEKLLMDVDLLQKIVNNLLSNAIRFSKKLIRIDLKVKSNTLMLSIEDDGSGMDLGDKSLNDFCQPFVQKKQSDQHFGLGLAIVSRSVKLLQGEMTMDNQSCYGGARFTVTLPYSKLS